MIFSTQGAASLWVAIFTGLSARWENTTMQNSVKQSLAQRVVGFAREAFQAWINTPAVINGYPVYTSTFSSAK